MGERLLCKQEVIGSIPFTSTIILVEARCEFIHGKRDLDRCRRENVVETQVREVWEILVSGLGRREDV